MEQSERENLYKNINFIIDSAHRQDIYDADVRQITRRELIEQIGMSYITYRRLMTRLVKENDYTPQDSTLLKFVSFFNQYWAPEIDIFTLKRKSLENAADAGVYRKKELNSRKLDFYTGSYLCYYFSKRSSSHELCYGIMNIYSYNNEYFAQMISGFKNVDEIDSLIDNQAYDETRMDFRKNNRSAALDNFFRYPAEVENRFTAFLGSLPLRDIRYYYYSGKLEQFEHSLVINLYSQDKSFKKVVALKRPLKSRQPCYQGGLGAMLTLAHEIHSTYSNTFQYLGLSRNFITDSVNLARLLSVTNDHADKWIELSKNDFIWFNLAVGRNINTPTHDNP